MWDIPEMFILGKFYIGSLSVKILHLSILSFWIRLIADSHFYHLCSLNVNRCVSRICP
jgi:hypothetical protein